MISNSTSRRRNGKRRKIKKVGSFAILSLSGIFSIEFLSTDRPTK